jgi:hypothetical protein
MLALRTGGIFGGWRRVGRLAVVTLVVAHLRPWCVSGVAVGELVLLGTVYLVSLELEIGKQCNLRIPRTVGAAGVRTSFARLDMRSELLLALATVTPDSLAGLPVDEVLASRPRRLLEDDLLVGNIPVRYNGWVLGTLLEDSSPLLPALLPLGLGALWGHTRALLAARVLAAGALLAGAEGGVANMALAVHTHLDRLLDTQDVSLGRVPFAGLELYAIELTKFLCALGKDLRPGNLLRLGTIRLLGGLGGCGAANSVSHATPKKTNIGLSSIT